ncbi:hypothetical protein [Jeongeupia sp. USM3]|uniref:hypothetical protein n=1 Tax=Jeongeupia sp. USM3 TaxID=1906741 RepID=UPI0011AB8C68|nr:hypothetical protein [Jeongeupia sp. USM3]
MRWQTVTIGQLTYVINLILGLTVATIGFQVTLLLNKGFAPVGWQKCTFSLSLLLLSASFALGIAVVVNRLRDFRATMFTAKLREQGAAESAIEEHRALYQRLGSRTWALFWWQLGTFGIGVALTVVSALASVGHKLL